MKKLPSSVVVYGRKIPIKYISNRLMQETFGDAGGVWHSYEKVIYINQEAPRETKLYWIYHEITHAMHTFTGIDQKISDEFIEILCQCNATLIEDIIQQASKLK